MIDSIHPNVTYVLILHYFALVFDFWHLFCINLIEHQKIGSHENTSDKFRNAAHRGHFFFTDLQEE